MNDLFPTIQSQLAHKLSDNLETLFFRTLNWGEARRMPPRKLQLGVPVNKTLTAQPVAQLSGVCVYRIDWPEDRLPGITARRAVPRALSALFGHTAG